MKNYFFYSFLFLVIACGGSRDSMDEQLTPETVILLFPEDNTECNEGTVLNESQSSVVFEWNESENTDMYEVVIENLESDDIISKETANNEMEIVLNRGKAYQWHVVSKSNISEEIGISDKWKFYNADNGVENHAPFPVDIISPEIGNLILDNTITLQWAGSDLDNDITGYKVYFGTENPPANNLGPISENKVEIDIVSGNIYYWYVITIDNSNNTSESDVFWFKVN